MSLKAKLEAVIYAAEEPVTLAQLASLFAEEALAWKAEQDAARAEAPPAAGMEASLPFFEEEPNIGNLRDLPPMGPDSAHLGPPVPAGSDCETPTAPELQSPIEETAGDGVGMAAAPGEAARTAGSEAEAKRQALLRDREVRAVLHQLLSELIESCASDSRGIEIREVAGGYRISTKPACHDAVRSFVKSLKPAFKLSIPALETLAVVAYKQPVTAPEVNEIRGVDSSGVFGSLLARKLITTAGRKQVIGRPILYKTTREFLLRFGLKDISELPSMEEFEKLAVELEASEGVETEITGEEPPALEDSAPAIVADLNLELHQANGEEGAPSRESVQTTESAKQVSTVPGAQ